jgi:integrase
MAHTLTSADLIRHVQSRRAEGAGPATVINDLIWVGVVLRAAKSVRELPVSPDIVEQARSACSELRLIGKPKRRTRRPSADELVRLREHFKNRDRRAEIPMAAVMDFAIASARRESEICRLEWRDNDKATRTGMVRDAKHPTGKDWEPPAVQVHARRLGARHGTAQNERVHLPLRPQRASALLSRGPAACWGFRICASMICGMRRPAACSSAATRFMRSPSSRCMNRGTNSSATRISSPRIFGISLLQRLAERALGRANHLSTANQPSGDAHQSVQPDLWH